MFYIAHEKLLKTTTTTQNHACSQRQIHTVHACRLSQAKNYQRTLIPIKYKQSLPGTHPFPKVQLYIVVKCRNVRVTNNDSK